MEKKEVTLGDVLKEFDMLPRTGSPEHMNLDDAAKNIMYAMTGQDGMPQETRVGGDMAAGFLPLSMLPKIHQGVQARRLPLDLDEEGTKAVNKFLRVREDAFAQPGAGQTIDDVLMQDLNAYKDTNQLIQKGGNFKTKLKEFDAQLKGMGVKDPYMRADYVEEAMTLKGKKLPGSQAEQEARDAFLRRIVGLE